MQLECIKFTYLCNKSETQKGIMNKIKSDAEEGTNATTRRIDDERFTDDCSEMADATTAGLSQAGYRGNIRVFEEGLAASCREHSDDSTRIRCQAESERLVAIAKKNGLFIPMVDIERFGDKQSVKTGESVVFVNEEQNKVLKVKNPYAKAALKHGVEPEDIIYEHIVHNLIFPEVQYTLEGISEEYGDVRLVLSQSFVSSYLQPTKAQIVAELAVRGLHREDNYSFGNEYVSVTDVEGDNVLLGLDNKLYFIDPIIRYKQPVKTIIATLF